MTIEQMIEEKKRQGFSNKMIAELSGVPYGTVQKIFGGETTSPRYETIQALQKFFEECAGGFAVQDFVEESAAYSVARTDTKDVKCAGESRKGDKTLEDYLALPEGARVEMIDGEFYDMAAPTTEHQDIAGELFVELKNHVRKNGGSCHPFIAPVDVQLDRDDKTIVQPDILILCDKQKLTRSRIVGAPDFIIEILSPSTFQKDLIIKGKKYQQAGVKEYWMIDPKAKVVLQYDYTNQHPVRFYSFSELVPILISGGHCAVDFSVISENMAMFFEDSSD